MLKLVIVTMGLGLGLIAGSASAVEFGRADWRLERVECGPDACTARLVSSRGDTDEIVAPAADLATARAERTIAYLNGEVFAGDLGNG